MSNDILIHHGIKGMKWGIRRFQKKDGSLTSAGKSRYGDSAANQTAQSKAQPVPKSSSREHARHIIEDEVSRDEVRRSRDQDAVKKHVSFGSDGKVSGISKELESFFGVPLSQIDDDDFVVYQAMVLEALKEYN